MTKKNWEFAAGIVWSILTEAAVKEQTLFYEDLAPHMKTTSRNVGWGLDPITSFCISWNLPHLTSIVVNKNTGKPGKGFYGCSLDGIQEAQKQVFEFNWENTPNPFVGLGETDTTETLARSLIRNPEKSGEVYAKIKVRGAAQIIFRQTLLRAYRSQCAICGLSLKEALEAAHIVPWLESSHTERMSPNNGILLCSNHYKLFDSGKIRVTAEYEIQDVALGDRLDYGPADIAATTKFNKLCIHLPSKRNLWPHPELLQRRLGNKAK